MRMKMIASVDENNAIGNGGELLIRCKDDMKRFRRLTMGGVVIMGRRTFMTMPNQKPLPGRVNIVLTHNGKGIDDDAIVVGSVEELMPVLSDYSDRDIWVIGGQSVYEQLLPYCDECDLTRWLCTKSADAFFPKLDADDGWTLTECSEEFSCEDVCYRIETWKRTDADEICNR